MEFLECFTDSEAFSMAEPIKLVSETEDRQRHKRKGKCLVSDRRHPRTFCVQIVQYTQGMGWTELLMSMKMIGIICTHLGVTC